GDNPMREAMFDRAAAGKSLLNPGCRIYQEIAKIAAAMRSEEALRFGRLYYRQISGDGQHFGFPLGSSYTLAFSRILFPNEVLIAYNIGGASRSDSVVIDAAIHQDGSSLRYLYGKSGVETVRTASNGTRFVKLDLAPDQFVILA